ncbi:LuxR family transcriptional regulator [Acidocella sp.]|uniref:LuxR family transcriptional regulator n=1 Tax=Acidocella sp. TaxID=50710 RepID=UPI00262333CF|nr:LuxR family transcriptional regulator [Acidocella sp.]
MSRIGIADQFAQLIRTVQTEYDLFRLMEEITVEMGFRHFALISHVDLRRQASNVVQIYNYPPTWVENFVRNGLYAYDPVLLASLRSAVGFVWSDIPTIIEMTNRQRVILENAAKHGLGDGFTIPAHIPGEIHGSCSFAMRPGFQVPKANLLMAQLIGSFAFQAARRLNQVNLPISQHRSHLTPRQRDCLLWAIRGKTDWEIGQILGLNEQTVSRHLDMARERYGVTKRLPLAVQAIFDGQISFTEALF